MSRKPTTSFILLDTPLSYPLFGFLPLPLPLHVQAALLVVFTLTLLGLFEVHRRNGLRVRKVLIELSRGDIVAFAMSVMQAGLGSALLWSNNNSSAPPTKSTFKSLRRATATPTSLPTSTKGTHYPGIRNTGNTCFFNSVLQSLAALAQLRSYLSTLQAAAEQWDVPTPVADALFELLSELNTRLERRHSLLPTQLTYALSNIPDANGLRSLVGAHAQQDAHELFVLLSSALDDECSAVQREAALSQRRATWGLQAVVAPSLLAYRTSTASNPFRGLAAQRTACYTCGYMEAVRHFELDELSLVVPAVRGGVRLEDCLANWTALEEVDWICHRCSLVATQVKQEREVERLQQGQVSASKKRKLRDARKLLVRVQQALQTGEHEDEFRHSTADQDMKLERVYSRSATKQVMLARPPKLLAIHLNRSNYSAASFGASKNNAQVVFPATLNVQPFTTDGELSHDAAQPISASAQRTARYAAERIWSAEATQPSIPKSTYRLRSVVVHYGGHHYGHYVAYRSRAEPGEPGEVELSHGEARHGEAWSRISDETVEACTLEEAMLQNPYLLFYERIEGAEASCSSAASPVDLQHVSKQRHGGLLAALPALQSSEMDRIRRALSPRVVQRWSSPSPSVTPTLAPTTASASTSAATSTSTPPVEQLPHRLHNLYTEQHASPRAIVA